MSSVVRHITFDVAAPYEPYEVARFWSHVVGHPVDSDCEVNDDEVGVEVPGQPLLLFIRVPEAKTVKNRVHLDVQPEGSRDEEVDRLVRLGAKLVDDQRRADGPL